METLSNSNLASTDNADLILLTGATGYIGGNLLRALERRGCQVRCMARRPDHLKPRVAATIEVVQADVLERTSLDAALQGVKTAYYLIHSMGSKSAFEDNDRRAAENFVDAAKQAGIERIIYVGGLGDQNESLSAHLNSRQEVGRILRDSGIPTLEFRASVVIGAGSLSFELIRSLVEKLPLMITPKWVSVTAQPICIDDLVAYLIAAMSISLAESRVVEVGGADQVSYEEIMRAYARCRNKRIWMIRVPFLTPYLSSLWLGLVTPVYARIGRKLIESIVHSTVVLDQSARQLFDIEPVGIEEAIKRTLDDEDKTIAITRWSDALSSSRDLPDWSTTHFGRRFIDSRSTQVNVSPAAAFQPIQRIGGETGWYAFNFLWRLRGFLDLLVGGIGMRRGRTHLSDLRVGDTVDFWRVEAYEPNRLLRLQAEMKVSGRAWLQFEVTPSDDGVTISQTALFDPLGLTGRLYWYFLTPVHQIVFTRMLRKIAEAAIKGSND